MRFLIELAREAGRPAFWVSIAVTLAAFGTILLVAGYFR